MAVLRFLFFLLIVRPAVLFLLGLYVRDRHLLPRRGPAIVVANHNSHLDTLVLMALFPLRLLPRLRPVGAADYYAASGPVLSWIAHHLVGILPIRRNGDPRQALRDDPLAPASAALARGDILIVYPEGTRGEPGTLAKFRGGVAHLAERFPAAPVVPVYLHGLGKAWPKGERWPVPLLAEVFVSAPIPWCGDRGRFVAALEARVQTLSHLGDFPGWGSEPSAAEEKRALEREEAGR